METAQKYLFGGLFMLAFGVADIMFLNEYLWGNGILGMILDTIFIIGGLGQMAFGGLAYYMASRN